MTIIDSTNLQALQQAEAGDTQAQFQLANHYANADFLSDNTRSFDWLEKAANHEHVEAQLTLGLYYLIDSDRKLLWKRWQDQKDANTPLTLAGTMVLSKLFKNKDDRLAIDWLTKAAEQKQPDAQFWLGYCYWYGIGEAKDFDLACSLFEQAANQNMADALVYIGLCYLNGRGVGQDDNTALTWLNKSVELGCDFGYYVMGLLCSTGRCVSKDPVAAFNWYQKAAYLNNADAQYRLARSYAIGNGVECDYEREVYWTKRAADNGHKEAKQFMIQDYLKKAADYGSACAHWALGELYKKGDGVEKNENLACDYFDRALFLFERTGDDDSNSEDLGSLKHIAQIEAFISSNGKTDELKQEQLEKIADNYKRMVQELNKKGKSLESEINAKELLQTKMQKLVEQFTHTLGNVIFPDTIYQVAERLKNNPACRKDVLLLNEAYHSEIIIKLQAELLRQRYANSNPEKFRQMIRACRRTVDSGDKTRSIADILDYAASRVAARFLNQHNASLGSIRDKILAQKNVSLDALRQQFEDDILLNRTLGSVEWINQYLRPFEVVELSPLWQKVYILAESHAEALLFGYFSEVLFNAFKYADHDAEKFLTVRFGETVIESKTYLSCSWSNPMGNKTPNSLGTGKGLDAILEDLQQLNETDSDSNSLLVTQDDEQFQVTMFFQKDLLIEETPERHFKRKTKTE